MRRSICLLSIVAAAAVAPLAFAQNAHVDHVDAADAGAPTASVTAAATTATTTTTATTATATAPAPPPTAVIAPSEPPPTTSPAKHAPVTEEEAFQLGRLVELEADRARGRRDVGAAIGLVASATVIASGALVFSLDTTGVSSDLVTVLQVIGGVEIGLGAVLAVESIVSLFVKSPMEKMFDAYAPIAVDKSLSPAERVHRGEVFLEAMASRERTERITGVAGNIVAGALTAALGIWLVADDDFWGNDPETRVYRPVVGALLGLSVVSVIGDAIGKLLWDRGPAELAWEHWHVSHEPASVQTSRLQLRPFFSPIAGGAMGGVTARF